MAYNTSPTPCYGSLNQDLDVTSPVGTWQTIPNETIALVADDGTPANISSHFASVSYTPLSTTYIPLTIIGQFTDPWGVELNHASPNDGYNVEQYTTTYQLDAAHQNNNTIKTHPELNNQLHDWHIDNGTLHRMDGTGTDYFNALGRLGPATGFGANQGPVKIYAWNPQHLAHESIFPIGTEIVTLGSSDTQLLGHYFLGWGRDYSGHSGTKAFCSMTAMVVQARKSTDPKNAGYLSGQLYTRVHNSSGGSQAAEFGAATYHLAISGLRIAGKATQNMSGTWQHPVMYGTSTWMRFGPVKQVLTGAGGNTGNAGNTGTSSTLGSAPASTSRTAPAAPTLRTFPPGGGGSILLLHSDADPPPADTTITPQPSDFLTSGTPGATSNPLTFSGVTNNSLNTIYYFLMDAAQNISFHGQISFYNDQTDPVVIPDFPTPVAPYTGIWLGPEKLHLDGSIEANDSPT